MTGLFWTKDLNKKDVINILNHLNIFNNDNNKELGFDNYDVAQRVVEVSDNIDKYCHSVEDNYMMELLANLTKFAIEKDYIKYEDLYVYDEDEIHKVFKSIKDTEFAKNYFIFKNIRKEEIPFIEMPYIKKRELNPLVRYK